LFILRNEIMALLRIDAGADLMGLYATGIIFIAVKEIADRGFYSMKNSKLPAVFGLLIMAVNIGLVTLLVPYFGMRGIPVAYGAAAFVGVGGLVFCLQRRVKFISCEFILELFKTICAAGLMVFAVLSFQSFILELLPPVGLIFSVVLPAVVGAGVYLLASFMLKIKAVKVQE
jgi:putative peptidoglycan lipid II flippase